MVREASLEPLASAAAPFARIFAVQDFCQLLELPPAERLQLVEATWDSLVEVPDSVPIDDDLRKELDRRIADYKADPSTARSRDDFKRRSTKHRHLG